jgi:hypothetical protein
MLSNLFVDAESLFEKFVFILFGNISELNSIVVVKSVDVVHNATGLRADSGKNKQVLEIAVLCEIRIVQYNAFKKFDELVWELSINEGTHSDGNLVNILGFGKGGLNNLVNDLLSVRVFFDENFTPKLS